MICAVKKISKKETMDKKSGLESKKQVKDTIKDKKNQYFNTLWSGIVFEYKEQNEGGKKLIAELPSGKYCFLDKGENADEIKAGIPYVCLIYEPVDEDTGKELSAAFAKVICEESVPKIIVHPEGSIYLTYKNDKDQFKKKMMADKSFGYRIVKAVRELENLGFEESRIVFVKNKMKKRNKVKN